MALLFLLLIACRLAHGDAARSYSQSRSPSQLQNENENENRVGATPPMGWNSWNHFKCTIDENIVSETADALVSTGLAAAGYKYVNIDDCWSAVVRDMTGNLMSDPGAFPSGIATLATKVHALGLKFGIYGDAGLFTCQGRPGSLGHEEQDANIFSSWGVDYLKYDNCNDNGTKPEIRYPPMRDAINKTGRSIFFSICEWGIDDPAVWARGVGNSWRTTGDISDSWDNMSQIAYFNNLWADYAGPGSWNDPDMLEVGNGGMTVAEYRSHFSLWSLMKAPLLIGCDVRNITKQYLEILTNLQVIAVNQDPLGIQGKRVRSDGETEIWAGPLSSNRTVVLLWNRSSMAATIVASWSDIGIPLNEQMRVCDLWRGKEWKGTYSTHVGALVASHDVAMFVLSPPGLKLQEQSFST